MLLHDHNAIRSFEDNRIAIPITVLEELDTFKVGNDTKNFEARECIRIIDQLSKDFTLQDWIPLDNEADGLLRIILSTETHPSGLDAARVFDKKTNDHKILSAALQLQHDEPDMKVVLVSKDINLRLKAKAPQAQVGTLSGQIGRLHCKRELLAAAIKAKQTNNAAASSVSSSLPPPRSAYNTRQRCRRFDRTATRSTRRPRRTSTATCR